MQSPLDVLLNKGFSQYFLMRFQITAQGFIDNLLHAVRPALLHKRPSYLFGRLLPETILYSSSRHSIAPLNSGVRFDGDRRISFRMALSAVNR